MIESIMILGLGLRTRDRPVEDCAVAKPETTAQRAKLDSSKFDYSDVEMWTKPAGLIELRSVMGIIIIIHRYDIVLLFPNNIEKY